MNSILIIISFHSPNVEIPTSYKFLPIDMMHLNVPYFGMILHQNLEFSSTNGSTNKKEMTPHLPYTWRQTGGKPFLNIII